MALPTAKLLREYPNFPVAATPARGRAANGRGITKEACQRSCLGELIELASSCSWANEPLLTAAPRDLGRDALSIEELVGLDAQQYSQRTAWNEQFGWFDWRPRPADPREPVDWLAAEDLHTGKRIWVPADAVLIGRREAGDDQAVAIADSNGCASGSSLEEATVSALLELIERDSLARWWYGGQQSAEVELSELCRHTELRDYLRRRERKVRLLKITSDMPVWSFVAVTFEPDGSDVAIGSAASRDPARAAESALIEVLQMEIPLEIARRTGAASRALALWRQSVSMRTHPLSWSAKGKAPQSNGAQAETLHVCLDACAKAGVFVYRVGLSRAELGVPSVRVLSPQLCHFKPRFNKKRLWESVPASERCKLPSTFNQILLTA